MMKYVLKKKGIVPTNAAFVVNFYPTQRFFSVADQSGVVFPDGYKGAIQNWEKIEQQTWMDVLFLSQILTPYWQWC